MGMISSVHCVLGLAAAVCLLFSAARAQPSRLECEVPGYVYKPGQLPFSNKGIEVVTLQLSPKRGSRELAAACTAVQACVMFTTDGYLLSLKTPGPGANDSTSGGTPPKLIPPTWDAAGCELDASKRTSSCCGTYVAQDSTYTISLVRQGKATTTGPLTDEQSPRLLAFSSRRERLQACDALVSTPWDWPDCPASCRVGCCAPRLLQNSRLGEGPDCAALAAGKPSPPGTILSPEYLTLAPHEQCREEPCMDACGFFRGPGSDVWDIVQSSGSQKEPASASSNSRSSSDGLVLAPGKPAATANNAAGQKRPAPITSVPVVWQAPPRDPAAVQSAAGCKLPGWRLLPRLLPGPRPNRPLELRGVVGAPYRTFNASLPLVAAACGRDIFCLGFTSSGRAFGLMERVRGSLSPVSTPEVSPTNQPSDPRDLITSDPSVDRNTTWLQLDLSWRPMSYCGGPCCGTWVTSRALRWRRRTGKTQPPTPGAVNQVQEPWYPGTAASGGWSAYSWALNTTQRLQQCKVLSGGGSLTLRGRPGGQYPKCSQECRVACCSADLNLDTSGGPPGCPQLVQQPTDQCTREACGDEACGFEAANKCDPYRTRTACAVAAVAGAASALSNAYAAVKTPLRPGSNMTRTDSGLACRLC
jgi:hypothetical protein